MVGWWIASYVFTFIFWSRCRCCCCCCLLLLLLPTTSVLKRTEMLGTSIAAVVLGCFYSCPSDSDASALVIDCAAVMTGCMLEKIIKSLQRNTCSSWFFGLGDVMVGGWIASYVLICIFWSRCCCCCCLPAAAAAHNLSTEAERDGWDVYCCCCSWLLLFLSFRLRCFCSGC